MVREGIHHLCVKFDKIDVLHVWNW